MWLVLLWTGCKRGPNDDPGTPVVPRLNRAEYDATVRDLFGTNKHPSVEFPQDESANGFDNQGAALTTTSLHVEAWEAAAVDLIDEMFGSDPEETVYLWFEVEEDAITIEGEGLSLGQDLWLIANGAVSTNFTLVDDGLYEIAVEVDAQSLDGTEPRALIRVDDELVAWMDVQEEAGAERTNLVVQTQLSVGTHNLEIGLDNPEHVDGEFRGLAVDGFGVEGPLDPEGAPTPAYDTWVGCASINRACAEGAIRRFGAAAWRRPLTEDDEAWILGIYDGAIALGEPPDYALRLAFRGILLSPDFLYRLIPSADGEVRALTSPEVATRLASFLWSSLPDQALADVAASKAGFEEEVLEAEVARMLADARASALVDNLAGQWLSIRTIDELAPAETFYPEWDEPLRTSMRTELQMLADDFFRNRITLRELLESESTWVDERLAEHYGLPWNDGAAGFQQMSTAGTGRVGILGTAGFLATQSHPDSPSAVYRGKWVLDRMLCDVVPPPPPGVMAVVEVVPEGGAVRTQEESRRTEPLCQVCHERIDGIGFVFGSFDAIGAWRTEDELGFPIDTSGALYGTAINDVPGLVNELLVDDAVPRCVVEQTLTYALGRPLREADQPVIDSLTARFVAEGLMFNTLAIAVAQTDAFLYRGEFAP